MIFIFVALLAVVGWFVYWTFVLGIRLIVFLIAAVIVVFVKSWEALNGVKS